MNDLTKHACATRAGDGVCRSRGGESCAFDGAMIVLQCIADAAHLVHGPIACLGNSWESRGTVSDKGDLHRRAYTTDIAELDIIHGAGEKLMDAILRVRTDANPRAIFVYATCVTGLIGEDIEGVCRRATEQMDIPVIPVNSPGFVGPKNLGNRIAGEALLNHVIGTGEPERLSGTDVNLVGEYNIAGDLQHIEPVLRQCGVRLLSRITGNSRYMEVTHAHRARLNVMVCSRALINVAREMEIRYGIPYIEASFFGPTQIRTAVTAIGEVLAAENPWLPGQIEQVLATREAALREELKPWAHLEGQKAVLYSGGVKSWAMISALSDLGIEVVAVGTKKSTAEDEEKMCGLVGPEVPLVENMTPAKIRSLMVGYGATLLVAGGRNRYLAAKEGYAFVDVNQERHHAYAGYEGFLNLASDISASLAFCSKHSRPARAPEYIDRPGRDGLSINPLRHSPAIGGALALQGIDRAVTVLHGAQGCNFLGKVLLTKHFMEPISMISTKLFSEDVVMGAADKLDATVRDLEEKHKPDITGIITTSLSEVSGEALGETSVPEPGTSVRLRVALPDYRGSMQEGYRAVVEGLALFAKPAERRTAQINLLAGHHHTPADVEEIAETVRAFGLMPVVLPDLSCLDGSREGFSARASGGTTMGQIRDLGKACLTIAIGRSLESAARIITEHAGVPYRVWDGLMGLKAVDEFVSTLSKMSGRPVPERLERQRRRLVDGMRDAAALLAGRTSVMALESDATLALSPVLEDMAIRNLLSVIPWPDPNAERISAERVVVGDYEAIDTRADLLVTGSHGEMTARRLDIRHALWGFPVFETLGYNQRVHVGYQGTLSLINRLGNLISGGKQ